MKGVLIVDLNNFAMYPTLSIGYLVAICRRAGLSVSVFSPLAIGVRGVVRERPATWWTHRAERLNFQTSQSRHGWVRTFRRLVAPKLMAPISRSRRAVFKAFRERLHSERPAIVLVSTYLLFRDLVDQIGEACEASGTPMLLGGPYFAQSRILDDWMRVPGLSAIAAGEVEKDLPAIVDSAVAGEDLTKYRGLIVPQASGMHTGSIALPAEDLNSLPFPDYSDFPWDRYPQRIVPIITGRGCRWSKCTFCSDVTSTAGRTFRSRDPQSVLQEVQLHYEQLGVSLFVFVDLTLNSSLEMWAAISKDMQRVAPGSRWIASVHVGPNDQGHGLTAPALRAAANSGCVRLTTGLESGSQRMLDRMHKGTQVESLSDYLHAAAAAGISTRCTVIAGYPGEHTEDVEASAAFVRDHRDFVARIKLCEFSLITGTPIETELRRELIHAAETRPNNGNHRNALPARLPLALLDYYSPIAADSDYRRAMYNLIRAVHDVNRRPLAESARVFEGVM